MVLVGLTGGIATGKSTVSRLFVECGAHLVDADVLAREVVGPGTPALQEIVNAFGPQMLRPDGTLDRDRLGHAVFGDAKQLARLNAIVHPYVAVAQEQRSRTITGKDPHAVIISYAVFCLKKKITDAQKSTMVARKAITRPRCRSPSATATA